jgi:hypothetical protein
MKKSYLLCALISTFLISSPIYSDPIKEKLEIKKSNNSSYVTSVSDPGWSYTCKDGIDVELLSLGIKNNVPASLAIPNSENVIRIVVEIVYKGSNPGSTITIEDNDGNSYTANREVPAGGSSNVWYYRTELPATSSINYNVTNKASKAQSMLAYVFRNKNNGIGSSGVFTAVGGYNNIEMITIPITTDIGPRSVSVELPVSELTPDGRYIHIEVSAADGSFAQLTENINSFPDGQCCIKVFELNLTGVAGNIDEIKIKIDTRNKKNGQSVNGQSWVMGGAVKTDVHCSCVSDLTPPEPDAASLVDLTDACSVAEPIAPTASDNCDGVGSIKGTTTTTFPVTTPGTTVVTWTYTDTDGNSSTQTQNIIIDDVTAPVADATSLADLTDACSIAEPTAPTATDNCDGKITGITTTTFPVTTAGTTIVTWTFTDTAGNSNTQTQNVLIDDVTAPVADAASLADLTGGCSVTAPMAPTASDNCDVAGSIIGTTTTTFPVTTQGTTIITWTFTDTAGNSSTQPQNVIINDVTPPTADNLEDSLLVFDFNNLPEVTFSDECSDVTIEYTQYEAIQSCWADFGPGNATANVRFEGIPFDENHHWEYGYVMKLLGFAPKVIGRVVNNTDPTSGWIVEIYFESLMSYNTWIAAGGQTDNDSLKDQRQYANVDFTKPYSFKGFGSYENSTITLLENTDPHYIEIGEKAEFGINGAGFKIAYEGMIDGVAIGNGGTQNIEMFAAFDRCIDIRGLLLVREWIVTDAAGNSQVFIQRLESEE